jgi:mono/diheme cytochrome c family protein
MKRSIAGTVLLGAMMVGTSGIALAAERIDIGKQEYENNCLTCHGLTGKGDGPYASYLRNAPSDLSLLAKKNKGVFPVARLYEVIDGREDVKGHGPRNMPIWGAAYALKGAQDYRENPQNVEFYVRARILALIEYVNRLQVK